MGLGCRPASVLEQMSLLRLHTALPLIFTVRSVAQGGKFAGDEAAALHLMRLVNEFCVGVSNASLNCGLARVQAVRAGFEYIDVEDSWSAQCKRTVRDDS